MVCQEQRFPVSRSVIGAVLTLAVLSAPGIGQQSSKKFYPDDPLLKEPPPHPVKHVEKQDIDLLYDFLDNSFVTPRKEGRVAQRGSHPSLDVNTVGEVPDSPWYTNRHYLKRMSLEELKRGPGNATPPSSHGEWRVVSAKSNGVMPGFVIEDERKNRYVLKFDPPQYPELASAADVIGSKVFYALGYNTPENYIVNFSREKLAITKGIMWKDENGRKKPLTERVLDELLKPQPKSANGTYRAMASRWISGDIIGPFMYEGARTDDPNDTVPHEDRRELRALLVFASWLNHTDAKSINTLDSLVSENGVPYLKHYLIDFGSILGSGGTDAKLPWYGHEHVIDLKGMGVQMVTLGFDVPPWGRTNYPKLTGVGRLDYKSFDPMEWKSDYPNPAFLLMDSEDAFWAAKQVAALSDAEIRALVETGEYSDPRAADWVTECLIRRRDKIAQAWFSKALPLDRFRVVAGELTFDDLGASRDVGKQRQYTTRWASIGRSGRETPIADALGPHVPVFGGDTRYLTATIGCTGSEARCEKQIRVYLRRGQTGPEVVGVDR
jgi:hypothetical protein